MKCLLLLHKHEYILYSIIDLILLLISLGIHVALWISSLLHLTSWFSITFYLVTPQAMNTLWPSITLYNNVVNNYSFIFSLTMCENYFEMYILEENYRLIKCPTNWQMSVRMLFGTIAFVHMSTLILPHPCFTCFQHGWKWGSSPLGESGIPAPGPSLVGGVPDIIPSPFRNWL